MKKSIIVLIFCICISGVQSTEYMSMQLFNPSGEKVSGVSTYCELRNATSGFSCVGNTDLTLENLPAYCFEAGDYYIQVNTTETDKATCNSAPGDFSDVSSCDGYIAFRKTHTCTPANDHFMIQDSSSNNVGVISELGHMYIKGSLTESTTVGTPPAGSFSIQDSTSDYVAYVDDSGNLVLEGTLSEAQTYSSCTNCYKIQDSSSTNVAWFDSNGNLFLKGYLIESMSQSDLNTYFT